jgi:hypothetical protein
MRGFEEFLGRGSTVTERPRVTIQRNGKLALNQAAIGLLGNPEAVVLLYAPDTRSMGLRPSSKRVPHAYQVAGHGGSRATVTIIAFTKHYGIDLSVTRSYYPALEDGVLVFDLDKGVPSGRSERPR